jgi:hypothetical protein
MIEPRPERLAELLPDELPCVGCGASIRFSAEAPTGSRAMHHPAPVCEHLRSMLQSMGIPEPPAGEAFLALECPEEAAL